MIPPTAIGDEHFDWRKMFEKKTILNIVPPPTLETEPVFCLILCTDSLEFFCFWTQLEKSVIKAPMHFVVSN